MTEFDLLIFFLYTVPYKSVLCAEINFIPFSGDQCEKGHIRSTLIYSCKTITQLDLYSAFYTTCTLFFVILLQQQNI